MIATENKYQFSLVQSLSHSDSATPWAAACQTSLSFAICWSWLTLTSIGSVMFSYPLVLCRPPLLLPLIFPSISLF